MPTTHAPVLELRGLGAGYGARVVLAEVDLVVAPRALTALMGPMGGGKSTLLRIAAGIAQRSATLKTWGEARYLGRELGRAGYPALVSQNARMLVASVFENLVGALPDRAALTRAQQAVRLHTHLEGLGCTHLLEVLGRQAVQLDRLDQRLVPILRQTLAGTPLLCVDEPTAGLDEDEAARVLALLRAWSRRHAVLMVSHHQAQVRACADHVALLAGGRIAEAAPAAAFFSRPVSVAARGFVAGGTCLAAGPDARAEDLDADTPPPPPLPEPARRAMSAWCGPRGFVWLEPGRLAGTPQPGIVESLEHDLDALVRVGVTRLLTLRERPLDCPEALAARGLAAAWEAIPDMQAPTLEQARRLCRCIDDWLAAGEVVAVHCRAGHGRTGTALAAWRIWRGASALDAVEGVRRLEPHWIQSGAQLDFLTAFAREGRPLAPPDPAPRRTPGPFAPAPHRHCDH